MEMDFEDPSLKSWTATDPVVLFGARIKQSVNNAAIANCLGQLARQATTLVLWLDCDREGEAIAFEVVEICMHANPTLEIFRAIFSALTRADLTNACTNLSRPNRNLAEAVLARSEIDLRIGAAYTRFLTLRYQNRLSGNEGRKLVSFGPCQFPTLGFVVAAFLSRQQFVSENFWYLKLTVRTSDGPLVLSWDRTRLFDQQVVVAIRTRALLLSNNIAVVTECASRPATKFRPLPLNTLELTKLATRYLRVESHRCMQIAESLYSKGMISYPRTETEKFHPSMDLKALVRSQANDSEWGMYAMSLLEEGRFTVPRQGKKDDQAHPPIHPLRGAANGSFENTDERRVFQLVTRHFLACCSPDAKGTQTHIQVQVGRIEKFHSDGLIVLERNWLDVYPYARWGGGAEGEPLPNLCIGQRLGVEKFEIFQGQTEPPSALSEEDLIDLMDKNGIGTDATMHEHIKTIQERGYCSQDSTRKFIPSHLGIALVKGVGAYSGRLGGFHLAKPTLRANMERDMGEIAQGRLNRSQYISTYVELMRGIFQMISDNPRLLDGEITSMGAMGTANAQANPAPRTYTVRQGLPGYNEGEAPQRPAARRHTNRRNTSRRPSRNPRNNNRRAN
jgi:DNA topoisomerase-3